MSVLHSRILSQPLAGGGEYHPAGTPGTPMEMPMAEHVYDGYTALYGTLHPMVTADGAVVPARPSPFPQPYVPGVAPAGRP